MNSVIHISESQFGNEILVQKSAPRNQILFLKITLDFQDP